jgi:hypothetical protein
MGIGAVVAGAIGITAASTGATAIGVLTTGLSGVVGGRAATLTSNILSGKDALDDYWNPLSMARDAAFGIAGTYLFGKIANRLTGGNQNYFTEFLPKQPIGFSNQEWRHLQCMVAVCVVQ